MEGTEGAHDGSPAGVPADIWCLIDSWLGVGDPLSRTRSAFACRWLREVLPSVPQRRSDFVLWQDRWLHETTARLRALDVTLPRAFTFTLTQTDVICHHFL